MRYLIIYRDPETGEKKVFFSPWFSAENNFNADLNMVAIDLAKGVFMDDRREWVEIEEDHL